MTREEQIVEYANSFKGKGIESDDLKEIIRLAIIDGAKWADAHPQEPSLPDNINKVAQKLEDYYDVGEEHGYLYCHRGDIKDAFIAGAEWMAEQGETIFDTIDVDGQGQRWLTDNLLLGDYDYGEEVIVQIRKKH